MGKKTPTKVKGWLSIIMVVLCAMMTLSSCVTGTESSSSTGTESEEPAVKYELDSGYYTYYYPNGIISETEYNSEVAVLKEAIAQGLKGAQEELDAYKASYKRHGNLYLNNDPNYGIVNDGEDKDGNGVSDEFEKEFDRLAREIATRYEAKGYPEYRVEILDDFVLRIQIPASEPIGGLSSLQNAHATFQVFAETGEMTILLNDSEVRQLENNELTDIIKEFSIDKQHDTAFIKVTFTDLGKEMIDEFVYEVEAAEQAKTNASSYVEDPKLTFMVGETTHIELNAYSLEAGYINSNYELRVPVAVIEELAYVETRVILLNSALHNARGFDIAFNPILRSQVYSYRNAKK